MSTTKGKQIAQERTAMQRGHQALREAIQREPVPEPLFTQSEVIERLQKALTPFIGKPSVKPSAIISRILGAWGTSEQTQDAEGR